MEPNNKECPTDQRSNITTATLHSSPSLHSSSSQTITRSYNVVVDNNTNKNRQLELHHTKEADILTNDSLDKEFVEQNREVS
jgi:hypothetical protein